MFRGVLGAEWGMFTYDEETRLHWIRASSSALGDRDVAGLACGLPRLEALAIGPAPAVSAEGLEAGAALDA